MNTVTNSWEFAMVGLNLIVTLLVLLINTHRSVKSKDCESECFGKECCVYRSRKEIFQDSA